MINKSQLKIYIIVIVVVLGLANLSYYFFLSNYAISKCKSNYYNGLCLNPILKDDSEILYSTSDININIGIIVNKNLLRYDKLTSKLFGLTILKSGFLQIEPRQNIDYYLNAVVEIVGSRGFTDVKIKKRMQLADLYQISVSFKDEDVSRKLIIDDNFKNELVSEIIKLENKSLARVVQYTDIDYSINNFQENLEFKIKFRDLNLKNEEDESAAKNYEFLYELTKERIKLNKIIELHKEFENSNNFLKFESITTKIIEKQPEAIVKKNYRFTRINIYNINLGTFLLCILALLFYDIFRNRNSTNIKD